jgi:hypothetical protein
MPIHPTNPSPWPRWLGLLHQRRGRRRRFGSVSRPAVIGQQISPNYYVGLVIITVVTLACFNMALGMAEGLPVNPYLPERMHYLATHTLLWQYGWLSWMAAALGLLVFCHLLTLYMPVSTLSRIGLSLVSIGIAPDISAEVLYAWVLPGVQDVETFLLLDRIAMLLTGLVGNGVYCLGGLCLNLALFANPFLSRAMLGFGLPSWLIGLLISVSTAMQHLPATAIFTAIAMVWNVLWMFWLCQAVLRHPPMERTDVRQ